MTEPFAFQSGWSYDEVKIAASVARMEAAGRVVSFADARPALAGNWERMKRQGYAKVLAQDDELKVIGHHRDTNTQARGTCVWQGTSRTAEDINISRIADGVNLGSYYLLAYEVGYAGCRLKFNWGPSHPWGCQCRNCPDGLMGSNAAEWLATEGIFVRGNYSGVDLTRPREDLAINWGNSVSKLPEAALSQGKKHRYSAHKASSLDEYFDGMSNKNWGANCLSVICTGTETDKDGYCIPDGPGGHCTENCGVVVTPDGEDALAFQQSWPLGAVHYPKEVRIKGGVVLPRPGAYFIRRSVLEKYLRNSELWLFDLPGNSSFRG